MPIRILHVVDTLLGMGGMEKGVVTLIQRMDPKRFEHILVVIRSLGVLADYLPRDRAKLICLGNSDSRFSLEVWKLARLIEEVKPDIVHSRNWGAIEAVLAGGWIGSCALVHSEHGMDSVDPRLDPWRRRWFRRLAFHLVDQPLSVSYHLRDLHAARTGFPASKIAVIHNGVDTTRFCPLPAVRVRTRQSLGIAPGEFCIGAVGRLEPVKDLLTLLRAAAEVPGFCTQWSLLIAGEGSEFPILKQFLSGRPELQDRVRFMGEIQDIPEFLNALDVYVLSSLYEGLSNSLLEAMATGLPVIASIAGGNTEVVVDGKSGLMFPVGESGALAAGLRMLCQNNELRERLGWQALERVQEHFSLDVMVRSYERLYGSLASPILGDHA
jgi:sugar transferase (PEP-CTERM/EpsH1 system associated)